MHISSSIPWLVAVSPLCPHTYREHQEFVAPFNACMSVVVILEGVLILCAEKRRACVAHAAHYLSVNLPQAVGF